MSGLLASEPSCPKGSRDSPPRVRGDEERNEISFSSTAITSSQEGVPAQALWLVGFFWFVYIQLIRALQV